MNAARGHDARTAARFASSYERLRGHAVRPALVELALVAVEQDQYRTKQERGFVLLAYSMAYAIEYGGTSLYRTGSSDQSELP